MRAEVRQELRRKLFHSLSLVYLAFYHMFGAIPFLWTLAGFILIEGSVELLRLRRPAFNQQLMDRFGRIHREAELTKVSGVFWTSLGCWLTVAAFGDAPRGVTAAILYLALGDGAAAIVGKAFGKVRFRIGGREKSIAGTAACLAVCLAAGAASGLSPAAVVAGAVTATLLEFLPVPIDDNFWIPLASGAAISLF